MRSNGVIGKVDGEFAPAELELIKMIGGNLGFSDEELNKIIEDHEDVDENSAL